MDRLSGACLRAFVAFPLCLLGLSGPPGREQPAGSAAAAWGQLRVEIVELGQDAARHPVTARCYLTDPADQFWSPPGAINYVKPPERHFISQGSFEISLPPRKYVLAVERGPEYRSAREEVEIGSGEARRIEIVLKRWTSMNRRGWYSGDLHNHRDWHEMPELLLAEDLNVAPTLTQWVWEDRLIEKAPEEELAKGLVRSVDATHGYSVFDTEIERLREGPGAVGLVGLRAPVRFHGYLLSPADSVFAEAARRQGGFVDAEKITWRDSAALVALGEVDFAGIVHNHFNRHGVETETDPWGMIPKERPEYSTPQGMPLWAMDVYYKFLNCGFKLPVSAGSASGVKPSPLGFNRVYVHLREKFGYEAWFRALKAGRSFATNGPMLFLKVNGHEPGETITVTPPAAGQKRVRLEVEAEASSAGELDRLEIVWKGKVVKTATADGHAPVLKARFALDAENSGWIAARAFEKPSGPVRFAHTSPIYVKIGQDPGVVREDTEFFLDWMDREIGFYEKLSGFREEGERQAMLAMFRRARSVYARLAASGSSGHGKIARRRVK